MATCQRQQQKKKKKSCHGRWQKRGHGTSFMDKISLHEETMLPLNRLGFVNLK